MKKKFDEVNPGEMFRTGGILYHKIHDIPIVEDDDIINAIEFDTGIWANVAGEKVVETFPSGHYDLGEKDVATMQIPQSNKSVLVDGRLFHELNAYNAVGRAGCWKYNSVKGVVYRNEGVDGGGKAKYRRLANQIMQVDENYMIKFADGNKDNYTRGNLVVKGRKYLGVCEDGRNTNRPYRAYYPRTSMALGSYACKDDAAIAYDLYVVGTGLNDNLNYPDHRAEYLEQFEMYQEGLQDEAFNVVFKKVAEHNGTPLVEIEVEHVENDWDEIRDKETEDGQDNDNSSGVAEIDAEETSENSG